ncbi:MAG: TonB-dependent receptor, partial [Bacteroidales bacterium]|nr:TonB-dependent receptor [Bacteroidales bacterium]
KANEKYHYQLAIGKGVRAPNLTERYINHFNVGLDAYEYVGNPELKPEKNYQTDFSIHKTGDMLSFEVNVFASYLTNFIDGVIDTTLDKKFMPCQPPANAKRFENIDEAFQAGYEISAKYSFSKNLSIEGNLYYTYAQNLVTNEPLSEIPPLSSTIALNYKNKKFYSIISARFAAEQKRFAESAGETPSDAFNTLDLKIGYKPLKMIEFDFGINNIFNANYYEHLNRPFKNLPLQSQFYEPGRNFIFSIRLKF